MKITDRSTELVVAAQGGDQRALDELIAAYLPLLYNIVGPALTDPSGVDDVVQNTLLRAVRDLREVRAPESFCPWLIGIAVREVSLRTGRGTGRGPADRSAARRETAPTSGPGGFEELTIRRLGLTGQSREVVEASRWLDPDDRILLALWWQEVAGRITRPELAEAHRLSVAYAGVRLQRMHKHLEAGRTIVAALSGSPRCPELSAAASGWDATPSPLWRKRLAGHARGCPACTATANAAGRIPAEKALAGLALVAVPPDLAAALTAPALLVQTAAVGSPSRPRRSGPTRVLMRWLGLQPVAVLAITAAVATGALSYAVMREPYNPPTEVVILTSPPTSPLPSLPVATASAQSPTAKPTTAKPSTTKPSSPRPTTAKPTTPRPTTARPSVRPTAPAGTVPLGPWSLESVDQTGRFLSAAGDVATLTPVSAASSATVRGRATFTVVSGLADADCVSFRTADGRYLRHFQFRLIVNDDDGTDLFGEDVTFCPQPGTAGSVRLRAHNYPDFFLHRSGDEIRLEAPDGTAAFTAASSFLVRVPWVP